MHALTSHACAREGSNAGRGAEHVSEFSRLPERRLKKEVHSFGPRPRRAPQTECSMMTCPFRFTEKYTWYSVFSSSQRRKRRYYL
jgi:hypothetical protein